MLPSAQTELTQLYQQNRWLDITDKPNPDELITLALERIKVDSNQYDLFVAMLQGITGLESIAHKVTSGKNKLVKSICCHSLVSMLSFILYDMP